MALIVLSILNLWMEYESWINSKLLFLGSSELINNIRKNKKTFVDVSSLFIAVFIRQPLTSSQINQIKNSLYFCFIFHHFLYIYKDTIWNMVWDREEWSWYFF